jgi:oxygen-independent coproporphyrinogen-3 oxidase
LSDKELNEDQASDWSGSLPLGEGVEGLYVHVPFCARKCSYCDFYSETQHDHARQRDYVLTVLHEAELWRQFLGDERLRLTSVYFGGGTPTLLSPPLMRELLRGLRRVLPLAQVDEWTLEANPATVDAAQLDMLRAEGVNRLSVGVQSFDDEHLHMLGRLHDAAAAIATLESAGRAGFSRLSADLIFGIPGQTLADWRREVETAAGLGLRHLSCYGLTYEEGTQLERRASRGELPRLSEEEELELFRLTADTLERLGIPRYEVSNFASPGEECRHNLMYWDGGNYLGLGPAGASHLAGVRWHNPASLQAWQRGIEAGRLLAEDLEHLTPGQRAGELAMLMLRTARGMQRLRYSARTGEDPFRLFGGQIKRAVAQGLLEVSDDCIRLTRRGFEVADAVAGDFLAQVHSEPL